MKTLSILILTALLLINFGGSAGAESSPFKPDYECLADAIKTAEGNDNYGILTHYKHTSYRQACINTAKHAWKDYSKDGAIASPRAGKATKKGYLAFLGSRYCPIGAKNDPTGLNKNWIGNVTFYYDKCTQQKEQAS